jgi:hypothetical protein
MKVMNDGFVYKLVSEEKAKDIFALGLFELYVVYDDDTESLIESYKDLNEAIDNRCHIGIEVGNLNTI